MSEACIRTRTLRFRVAPAPAAMEALTDRLKDMPGIISVDYDAHRVFVGYRFPETTLETILTTAANIEALPEYSLFQRCQTELIIFMEQNERDNIDYPTGWSRYVEDIYLHYREHHRSLRTDNRKHRWRDYERE